MLKQSEGYFRGKSNFELFYQMWESEKPDGTLVVTHGLGEHSESYHRLIQGLSHLNMRFIVWDLRGHGRSEGKRGIVKSISDYSDDLGILIQFIREEISDDSIFLLGHSLGGLVNLNALVEKGDLGLKGVCLSSPLLGITLEASEIKKMGAKYIARYLPRFTMSNEIPDKILTHDKKVLEEFAKDPLRHDRISAGLYLDMLSYTKKVCKMGDRISLPILFQLAGQDKVVSTKATLEFYETLSSKDKTKMIYENSFHEIFNDIEREQVFQDLSKWLQQHLAEIL